MHIELISYTTGSPQLMCRVREDGSIEEEMAVPPATRENIAAQKVRVPEGKQFLRSLLYEYTGSYLRAKLVP